MNPQATITAKDGTKLDASVVNLAKAIRTVESGGNYDARGASGEHGAYQWMPGNYEAGAKKYGIDPKDKNPINQDKVAYNTLKEWKDKGLTPAQIAAKWNSGGTEWEGKVGTNKQGVKYDVPAYVGKVVNAFRAVKAGQEPIGAAKPQPGGPDEPQAAPEGYQPWFHAEQGDNPLMAGAKALGNLVPSAFNFGKNVISALNPVNTLKTLSEIPGAFQEAVTANQGSIGTTLGRAATSLPGELVKAAVPQGTRELFSGDVAGAAKTFAEDPFGQVAPYAFLARPGARGVDALRNKAAMSDYVKNLEANTKAGVPIPKATTAAQTAVESTVTGVARPVIGAAKAVAGKASGIVTTPAKYAFAKATGLNPETISQVAERPKDFTPEAMATMSRKSLGEEVASKLAERRTAVSEAGKEYAPIRAKATRVKVVPNYIDKTIAETTGLKVTKGKLSATGSSSIRDGGDIRALQQVYDLWKPEFAKGYLTADQYLNFRSDLGKMAGYGRELTKSKPLQNLADIMRGKFNTEYRGKIKGLEELDKRFGPITKDLKTLSKGFIDKDGNLTDAAINRIANAAGKGKDALLARLEEVSPGITLKIRTLKAIEDIQNIHKVGTYTKTAIEGGGLIGGLATGNIALVVGSVVAMLLTQPEMAVRMIRGYGNSKALAGAVLDKIKSAGGVVNNLPEQEVPTPYAFGQKMRELSQ